MIAGLDRSIRSLLKPYLPADAMIGDMPVWQYVVRVAIPSARSWAILMAAARSSRLWPSGSRSAEVELAVARELPDYCAESRQPEETGVRPSDRLDVAALKLDRALDRAYDRITFCADCSFT